MLNWKKSSNEKQIVTIIGIVTLFLSIPTLFFEWFTSIVFITIGITGLILSLLKKLNAYTVYFVVIGSFVAALLLVTITPENLNWDEAISLFSFGLGIILILRKENLNIININKEEEYSKHKYWYVANKMKHLAESGEFRDIGHDQLSEIGEILEIEPDND